jgi:hypothetical protein
MNLVFTSGILQQKIYTKACILHALENKIFNVIQETIKN